MTKKIKEEMSAGAVLEALQAHGPLKKGPHAWLREVRNATGYSRHQTRYADALVVSLWPSRGIWFAGVEVKVDRKDWLRELKDPNKSSDIQRFCNYWWIATPPDIVKPEELPKNWGHFVVTGKQVKVAKQAPELKPEPLAADFVASVIRNASEKQDGLITQAHFEGGRKERESNDQERLKYADFSEQIYKLTREKDASDLKIQNATHDLEKLRGLVKMFEEYAGIPVGSIAQRSYHADRDVASVAETYKLAVLLQRIDAQRWVSEIKTVMDSIDALCRTAGEAKTGT